MDSAYGTGWHLPLAWLAWLATTDLRLWIYEQRGLYGVMRFLHLVGMAGFVGGVVVNAFRRMHAAASVSVAPVRGALPVLMHTSFAVVLLSGLWLFLRDPLGMGTHTMFLPKLALIGAGGVYVHFRWRTGLFIRRAAAVGSVLIWMGVTGLSTWNHVERPVNINAALRATNTGRN